MPLTRVRRRKRWPRLLLGAGLLLLDLVLAVYLLRAPLLEPLLRRMAQAQLGAALGGEVWIGAVEGDWVFCVRARGVRVRGGASAVLAAVDDGVLEVRIAPFALLCGDLAGVRAARLSARAVVLNTDPAGAASDSGARVPDLSWLARLAPLGIAITADELVVRGGGGQQRGRLDLRLRAGHGERDLEVRHGDTCARLRVDARERSRASAQLHVVDPGAWLRTFGVPLEFSDGALDAMVQASSEPPAVLGELSLSGTVSSGLELPVSRIGFAVDARELRLPWVDLELAGVVAHARGVVAPWPRGDRSWLDQLAGEVDVVVADLRPHAALLPAEFASLLPMRGVVRLRAGGGALTVPELSLQAEDLRLRGGGGGLSLLHPAAFAGALAVQVESTGPHSWSLPGVGRCTLQGRVRATVRGALAQPVFAVQLDLGPGEGAAASWSAARGEVRWAEGRIETDALDVLGLDLAGVDPWFARFVPGDVTTRGAVSLGGGAFPAVRASVVAPHARCDGREVALHAEIDLAADGRLQLAPLALRGACDVDVEGTLPLRAGGDVALRVEARNIDLDYAAALALPGAVLAGRASARVTLGGTLAAPQVEIAADGLLAAIDRAWGGTALVPPLAFELAAAGRLGLGLSPAFALQSATSDLRGSVLLRGELVPDVLFAVHGAFAAADTGLVLDVRELSLGPGRARGQVRLGARLADLIGVGDDPAAAAWSGELALADFSLRDWPAPWLRLPVAIDGEVDGRLRLAGTFAAPDPQVALRLRDGVVPLTGSLRIEGITADLAASSRCAEVTALRGSFGTGTLQGNAFATADVPWVEVDPARLRIGGALELYGAAVAPLAHAWAPALVCAGRVTARAQWAGTLAAPNVTGHLALDEGALAGDGSLGLDAIAAAIDVRPTAIELTRLDARAGSGALTGRASLGLSLGNWLTARGDPGAAVLRGQLQLADLDLARLPRELLTKVTDLDDVRGVISARADCGGTLARPLPNAVVTLTDGTFRIGGTRLEHLQADLALGADRVDLRTAEGVLGAGTFRVQASLVAPAGATVFGAGGDAVVDATLVGRDVLLHRARGIRIRADADLAARGPLHDIDVSGEVALTAAKVVQRVSLLPDLKSAPVAAQGVVLPSLPAAIGDHLHLDVALRTVHPLAADTNVFDGQVDAALQLLGTAAQPRLRGSVSSHDGILTFPGARLKLDNALLTFASERSEHPELLVQASGKRQGIHVQLVVRGRIDAPEVVLTSSPALPPQDLIVLLMAGTPPAVLAEMGPRGQAALVGSFLAEEIFATYFGSDSTASGSGLLDRFHFEPGREVSRRGVDTLWFAFDLDERFALQAERDVYDDFNMGLGYRIRF